jgi:hypothetical protein
MVSDMVSRQPWEVADLPVHPVARVAEPGVLSTRRLAPGGTVDAA